MKKRFQFVWWFPGWPGFHFGRWPKDSSWRYIYDWHLFIGWLEIRKWHKLTEAEQRQLENNRTANMLLNQRGLNDHNTKG